mmetsp:Transcript_2507/g.3477  ORF Transcript_2507/g.3477 Transcript_2507/m.3477 type:complete len:152 (+) Transcript_2507:293-748(+)
MKYEVIDGRFTSSASPLEVEEFDMEADVPGASIFYELFDKNMPGFYTFKDSSDVKLIGTKSDRSPLSFFALQFKSCIQVKGENCASQTQIDQFLEAHELSVMSTANFIDMAKVEPLEQTLKKAREIHFFDRVSLREPKTLILEFNEVRTEL